MLETESRVTVLSAPFTVREDTFPFTVIWFEAPVISRDSPFNVIVFVIEAPFIKIFLPLVDFAFLLLFFVSESSALILILPSETFTEVLPEF